MGNHLEFGIDCNWPSSCFRFYNMLEMIINKFNKCGRHSVHSPHCYKTFKKFIKIFWWIKLNNVEENVLENVLAMTIHANTLKQIPSSISFSYSFFLFCYLLCNLTITFNKAFYVRDVLHLDIVHWENGKYNEF
jgi:hypothetical protein